MLNGVIAYRPYDNNGLTFSPAPQASVFVVGDGYGFPGEVYRTADGTCLAQLNGRAAIDVYGRVTGGVVFSPAPQTSAFVISYQHGHSELWRTLARQRLTDLGLGMSGMAFDAVMHRFGLRYTDGRDVDWLIEVGGAPIALSAVALAHQVGQHFFTPGQFEENLLTRYLNRSAPRACK